MAPSQAARLFRRLYGGNQAPRVDASILHATIIDDMQRGPYPPYIPWQCGTSAPAAVGTAAMFMLQNQSGNTSSSVANTNLAPKQVVVIERFLFRLGAVNDIRYGVAPGQLSAAVPDSTQLATHRAPEADPTYNIGPSTVAFETPVGDVQLGLKQIAVLPTISCKFNPGDTAMHEIVGPWIVGPFEQMIVASDVANVAMSVAFFGRLYVLG